MQPIRTINSTVAVAWIARGIAIFSLVWSIWSLGQSALALRDQALSEAGTVREDRVKTDDLRTIDEYRAKLKARLPASP